ncbi:MAG: hypothetical protein LBR26_11955 [Prevotella sp.]|jgi:hypothetical protein|nr:hypothetical protein [Prevotella sp.]
MKELSKIRLKDFVEMDDREMKFIVGGSGSSGGGGSGDSGSSSGSGSGNCGDDQPACSDGFHCCCGSVYKGCYKDKYKCVSACL